jgi:hypothetical protein
MRLLIMTLLLNSLTVLAIDLHDGHIHYNQSVWKRMSPEEAVRHMGNNAIVRAIVSSTPAEGTEALYQIAPQRIIPFLRPYRTSRDVQTWHHNPEILDYVRSKARSGIYRGFGEFHMWHDHLDGHSIVPQLMQIAADNQWSISAHTDRQTIVALIEMQPSLNMIWAHCGFDVPAQEIRPLIESYPNFYCEMSFYEKLVDEDDNLLPEWKALMEDHPDRFMVGTDPYKDARWGDLQKHTDFIQEWLAQLSPEAASLIAQGNVTRLFPVSQ